MRPVSIVIINLRLHQIEYNRPIDNKGDKNNSRQEAFFVPFFTVSQNIAKRRIIASSIISHRDGRRKRSQSGGDDMFESKYVAIIVRIIEKHLNSNNSKFHYLHQ
jgi:hypothetical protein